MQYLLTQEERDNLVSKKHYKRALEALELARILIISQAKVKVSDNLWRTLECGSDYCSNCPIGSLEDDYLMRSMICNKNKKYGK